MKIALYSTTADTLTKEDASYPIGLGYLGAVLENDGHEVMVENYFNLPWKDVEVRITEELARYQPDIVGVSVLTMNRTSSFKTTQLAKSILPEVKVIAGGVHTAALYEGILSTYPVDAIVIGEGEMTVPELMRVMEGEIPITDVRGIAVKLDGKIHLTPARELIKELDTIPFPKHEYFKEYIEKTQKGHIMSTRGCPVGCQFCSTTQYWGKTFRARSPKNVLDEIEMLIKRFNVKHIMFMDDAFSLNQTRVIDICKGIIERGFNITWEASTRVTAVSEEMISWMVKAGCIHVALGIESGSARILKNIGKHITPAQIKKAFDILSQFKLGAGPYLMVGNPGETEETIAETKSLLNEITTEEIRSVGILQIYPQTKLYELAKENGMINDDFWLTDQPIPYYTAEHSLSTLKKFAISIILHSCKKKGLWGVIKFFFTMLRERPIKNMKIVLRYSHTIFHTLFR
ncbi:MAG: radical SAM protein [bacterium]|nr:radical SAM protein [bacterium]